MRKKKFFCGKAKSLILKRFMSKKDLLIFRKKDVKKSRKRDREREKKVKHDNTPFLSKLPCVKLKCLINLAPNNLKKQ